MAGGIAFGLGLLALAGALLAGVVAVLARQSRRRLPPDPPAAITGVGAVIVAAPLLPHLGDGRERADCATFAVRRADWTSRDPDVRLRSADAIGVLRCARRRARRGRRGAARLASGAGPRPPVSAVTGCCATGSTTSRPDRPA